MQHRVGAGELDLFSLVLVIELFRRSLSVQALTAAAELNHQNCENIGAHSLRMVVAS